MDPENTNQKDVSSEPLGVKRLIVVGGGRGGVGRSVISQNLAVYLAQLGKRVVLVDADPTRANMHAHFGLTLPPTIKNEEAELTVFGANQTSDRPDVEAKLLSTSIFGLSFFPYSAFIQSGLRANVPLRAARMMRWLSALRSLAVDYVLINAGPGCTPLALDLMLAADLPICVTTPEPPAVESTYLFLRAIYMRSIRREISRNKLKLSLLERALLETGPFPGPVALALSLAKIDEHLASFAWSEARKLHFFLVVNQARVGLDFELGAWMSELTRVHYGLRLTELGHVEHDDTVWLAIRRKKPVLLDNPASKSSRNIERVGRRIAGLHLPALHVSHEMASSLTPLVKQNHYEKLSINRAASEEEIRRAYKRKREIYHFDSIAISSLFDKTELLRLQGMFSESYDTLLDPIQKRLYDKATFKEKITEPDSRGLDVQKKLNFMMKELEELSGKHVKYTGKMLRNLRETHGVTLSDLAKTTKISKIYLEAIEDERYSNLPALVYVRGFLGEYARYFKIDPIHVQRSYLAQMKHVLSGGKE